MHRSVNHDHNSQYYHDNQYHHDYQNHDHQYNKNPKLYGCSIEGAARTPKPTDRISCSKIMTIGKIMISMVILIPVVLVITNINIDIKFHAPEALDKSDATDQPDQPDATYASGVYDLCT